MLIYHFHFEVPVYKIIMSVKSDLGEEKAKQVMKKLKENMNSLLNFH
jgi:hypothetical protein